MKHGIQSLLPLMFAAFPSRTESTVCYDALGVSNKPLCLILNHSHTTLNTEKAKRAKEDSTDEKRSHAGIISQQHSACILLKFTGLLWQKGESAALLLLRNRLRTHLFCFRA